MTVAKIDLVFRQVDERTRELSLKLAKRHIQPENVHVIDDVRPFTECVNQMLRIDHQCDYVVYLDADCLILEDLRPFLDQCTAVYIDSFVSDRFRGRVHCGLHITRIDLVRAMASVEVPEDDMKYVLRPESRLRNLAMKPMRMGKRFRNFDVLHDHFQYYRHIFVKYALRELRSRSGKQLKRLEMAMDDWPGNEIEANDYLIAREAIQYARRNVDKSASPAEVHAFIETLPERSKSEMGRLGIQEKSPFTEAELNEWLARNADRVHYGYSTPKPKVFGIGLSRTGTRSLTAALQMIGFDAVHYPIDEDTFTELAYGQYDLSILKNHDGLTDISAAPFFAQLDAAYPGSKFILTVRDTDTWLKSCENHWFNRPAFKNVETTEEEIHLKVRRLLRAATYGTYAFVPERFRFVYEQHVRNVKEYFKDRPDDLLVIDIVAGGGFEKLAPFLGRPTPREPFPHKGNMLSKRMAAATKMVPESPPSSQGDAIASTDGRTGTARS